MKNLFLLASMILALPGSSFASEGTYCAVTAITGAVAIAKINDPLLTKRELSRATAEVVDDGQFIVSIKAVKFHVTTESPEGDCLITQVTKSN